MSSLVKINFANTFYCHDDYKFIYMIKMIFDNNKNYIFLGFGENTTSFIKNKTPLKTKCLIKRDRILVTQEKESSKK